MRPFASIGRHRAAGPAVRLAAGARAPRHAGPAVVAVASRTNKVVAGLGVVVAVAAVAGWLSESPDQGPPTWAQPVGASPATVKPGTGAPRRAVLPVPTTLLGASPAPLTTSPGVSSARPRPVPTTPVLLGPGDLAAALGNYCRSRYDGVVRAVPTDDGWRCTGPPPRTVDMDAACRFLYGEDGWADLVNEDDQRSWRCYRDGP